MCPGPDWSILAVIGKIESDHGSSTLPGVPEGTENPSHARGPMQFLQPTVDSVLARHTIPPGGKHPPSPWDKHDAIFAYNHAEWYVDKVLAQATQYRLVGAGGPVACGPVQSTAQASTGRAGGDRALAAVAFACAQLGKPYVWGGDGDPGFDCSSLTHAAYAAAGITIARTAQTQYNSRPLLPPGAALAPGDFLFFGTPNHLHHVGLYIGGGFMIDSPDVNQVVKTEPYRHPGDDYVGATRPTGSGAAVVSAHT